MLYVLIGLLVVYGLVQVGYQLLFTQQFDSYLKNEFKRKIHLGDMNK